MELKAIRPLEPDIHPTAIIDPTAILHHNVKIGPYAVIGPGCEIGEGSIIESHAVIAENVRMGKNNHIFPHAVIGAMSGVHQFVKVGALAMVGGMSKIVQDVCPFVIADGNPARVVGLNSVGIARNNISADVKSALKKAYRLLFRSGLKLNEAIEEMEQELPSTPEIEHLLYFLRNCDRGLCRTRDR